ncbi:hypothetical protein A3K86_16575 [Photobacterium jeanii]|uniref:Lipase chaperone n=1 Tax=Photobacterium jeanii TaxID=858640 RepID=A0A178K7J7_9GAMM|nr:lipase secretion chaperone [Photobacterium jeanii]OAN13271.1 hypothetical protein A3K86_16575 [Photobacterium jeanii]PST90268.1 lipase chaperone [Photobacterium jeanii]
MKRVLLSILCLAAVGGAAYQSVLPDAEFSTFQVASQADTAVDQDSARDTFDYFLSGVGEAELSQLHQHFTTFNQAQAKAYQLDPALFDRFIEYRAALVAIDPDNLQLTDVNGLQNLYDQLIALQLQFFTVDEQQLLFGEENQLRRLALLQLQLKQQAIDIEDYEQQWQQELEKLPPALQESYRNASLLINLQHTQALDDQERFLQQQALVGTEAAIRLEQLHDERVAFQSTLNEYLVHREAILADESIDLQTRQQEIEHLRKQTFPPNQQRRVQALETMDTLEVKAG